MIANFFACFSESPNFTILHSSICILAHFFALSDFYLAVHSLSVSRAQRRALDCLLTPTNWKQILPIVSMKYIGKWKLKKNDFVRFGVQTLKVKANWKSTSARCFLSRMLDFKELIWPLANKSNIFLFQKQRFQKKLSDLT